jgi:hypothetical protein
LKQSAHPRYAVYILEADIQLSLSLSPPLCDSSGR